MEEGGVTKAAKALHMAQPPLSKQLQKLEEELGTQLFIRSGTKLILTPQGALLNERAVQILRFVERTKTEIAQIGPDISGTLRIASIESYALNRLPPILGRFKEKYPKVNFDLLSTTSLQGAESVRNNLMDIGIIRRYSVPDDLEYVDLEVQNWFVLFPKDHPLAQNGKSSVTLEELSKYDLLLPKNSIASQTIRGLFHMSGFHVNVCAEYEPWTLGARLTSAGVGLALAPITIGSEFRNSRLAAKVIDSFDFSSTISVIYNSYSGLSQLSKTFLSEILGHAPNHEHE